LDKIQLRAILTNSRISTMEKLIMEALQYDFGASYLSFTYIIF